LQTPYTSNPHDAFVAAQASVGAALSAVAWFRLRRIAPRGAFALLLVGIWGCALATVEGDFLRRFGFQLDPSHMIWLLGWSSTLATVAVMVAGPWWIGLSAVIVRLALAQIDLRLRQSDGELAVLHLVGIGFSLGLLQLADRRERATTDDRAAPPDLVAHDIVIFFGATVLACMVSILVLGRSCDSADEWSYTFQAAVFAKGRAYSAVPPCMPAFQNFWVFWKDGRMFSQYMPGWPLLCAPFQVLGLMWLVAPVTHGLLAVGVARLARRAVSESRPGGADPKEAAIAGLIAAATVTVGSTMLINGASRFPHTFQCALFAWCVEATCVLTTPGLSPARQTRWGVLLGLAAAFMLGTRPSDGAMLGFSIFIYFAFAFFKGRIGLRAVLATAISLLALGGLFLVILRLQLGAWFKTGYSLSAEFHPWAKFRFELPAANEYKWPFPLATGSYCWWPCAPALGVAGMAALLRPPGRRIAFMLGLGVIGVLAFYTALTFGRGWDFGYGPRYQMPAVVPMAVGGAVVLAPLFGAALSSRVTEGSAHSAAGPAALALLAAIAGTIVIAPFVYPPTYNDVRLRNVVFRAAREHNIHNAVISVSPGATISHPLDLTQNLPLDLYPNQDVIVISDSPEVSQCVKNLYPQRRFFRVVGRSEVALVAE
jgi:hypothetical protein